jgi:hypothetical protein
MNRCCYTILDTFYHIKSGKKKIPKLKVSAVCFLEINRNFITRIINLYSPGVRFLWLFKCGDRELLHAVSNIWPIIGRDYKTLIFFWVLKGTSPDWVHPTSIIIIVSFLLFILLKHQDFPLGSIIQLSPMFIFSQSKSSSA